MRIDCKLIFTSFKLQKIIKLIYASTTLIIPSFIILLQEIQLLISDNENVFLL